MVPVLAFVGPPQPLEELRPRQRHRHVEGDLVQGEGQRQREGLLDGRDRLSGVADDEERGHLDAGLAVQLRGADPVVHGHLLVHEPQGGLAAGLQPQIDPAAPGRLHAARDAVGDAVRAREAAPRHPRPFDAPAELLQVRQAQRERVVGDPQAVVAESAELLDLREDDVEAAAADDVAEDGLGAELAAVRAAQRREDGGRLRPGPLQPLTLVGGVIDVASVRQGERRKLALRVVHGGIVDLQPMVGDVQPGIAVQRQLVEAGA